MNKLDVPCGPGKNAHGRISTAVVVTLALGLIVGLATAVPFTRQAEPASAPRMESAAESTPFVSHALRVSATAETYSATNPQPPSF